MDRYEWRGDFLGFTLDGVHSSSLGIVRVSDGSRYNEELVPEFEDKIVKVSGRNDTYYFGSEYKQRTFEIKIAFDHLTEKQLRQLRILMNGHGLKDLIFDEAPYKVYKVKCNGTASLTYLCFEENYDRIYKGEGTLNFVAYFPFARSRFNYIEEYNAHNIPEWGGIDDNRQEWAKISGIPSNTKTYTMKTETVIDNGNTYNNYTYTKTLNELQQEAVSGTVRDTNGQVVIFKNPGDISTNMKVVLRDERGTSRKIKVSIKKVTNNNINSPEEVGFLTIQIPFSLSLTYYYIDMNNHLITRYWNVDDWKNPANGVVVNDFIISGNFVSIPASQDNEYYYLELIPLDIVNSNPNLSMTIYSIDEYNYLYY